MRGRLGALVVAVMLTAAGGAWAESPFKSGMVEVAEPALYYEESGRGPAVVLIHGGQLDRRMWDTQFRDYARSYRVIRYDVRGYGRSQRPTQPYSDTKDLLSLLDALGVRRAHLVGLSLGGRIALDFVVAHPDRVASLVLAGPGLGGFPDSPEEEKRFVKILRAAQDGHLDRAAELWLKDPYMAPAMEHPELAPRIRQLALDNADNNLANPLLNRAPDPPTATRLGEIRAPTLIILGSRDVPWIKAVVETLGKKIPQARKVVIEGAGHMVNMEKPAEFDRAVLGFLKEQTTKGGTEPAR